MIRHFKFQLSAHLKKSSKVVTTLKNSRGIKRTWSSARFVRQTPSEKQTESPNRLQSFYRARHYDVTTGEFTSRDPLEYVDGMSLYTGYFVPALKDTLGTACGDPKPHCEVVTGPEYNIKKKDPIPFAIPRVPWVHDAATGESFAPFLFFASFEENPETGAECRCCQVRQYIKWTRKFLKTNEGPTDGFDPDIYGPGKWHEDRDRFDKRFGHRDGIHSTCNTGRTNKDLIDNYFDVGDDGKTLIRLNCANGCVYRGSDKPGGLTANIKNVRGNLYFKLEVIDVCNGDKVVKSSSKITVSFDHQDETIP